MALSKRLALLAARSALSASKPRGLYSSNGRRTFSTENGNEAQTPLKQIQKLGLKDSKLSKSESETKIYKIYPERLPWAEEKLAKIDENSAKMRAKFEAQMSKMEKDSVASFARLKTASDKILTVDLPIILCMAITWTAMIAHEIRLLKSRPQTESASLQPDQAKKTS
ncbi:hypothetical protein ISN44_As11g011010 [Arabidopsis suecica]|uniref:Uncharacterized protein n=1 Tax=Arabidopsis suecica TaxID=45249 RepID=A0A8T1Z7B3_ARASU|nr:hypothetical protein ISN44_As11g011010 [Arabidopsis suecica]